MALRFRKSIKIIPGVRLNIGKSGASFTLGGRGASINVGKNGTYANLGIPGSGLSTRTKISGGNHGASASVTPSSEHSFLKRLIRSLISFFIVLMIFSFVDGAVMAVSGGATWAVLLVGFLSLCSLIFASYVAIVSWRNSGKEKRIAEQKAAEESQALEADFEEFYDNQVAESVLVDRNLNGSLLEKQGDIDTAIQLYELNIADRFDGSHPYDRLRIIYSRLGRFDDAIRVCKAYLVNGQHNPELKEKMLEWIGKYEAKKLSLASGK